MRSFVLGRDTLQLSDDGWGMDLRQPVFVEMYIGENFENSAESI